MALRIVLRMISEIPNRQ